MWTRGVQPSTSGLLPLTASRTPDTRPHRAAFPMLSLALITAFLAASDANSWSGSSIDRAATFQRVYDEGRWIRGMDGARRCPSGWSDVSQGQGAEAVRAVVSVVDAFAIRSIADVPCGDGCFAAAMLDRLRNRTIGGLPPPEISYIGVDIVQRLIESNRAAFGNERTQFFAGDVISGNAPLPTADLIFSRQMLQHLCNEDVLRFIRLLAHSTARFALLTTFKTDATFVNTDIPCTSGGFRAQDLTKPPFSLPAPLLLFDEMYPIDRRVSLGLWPVSALRSHHP